MIGDFTILQRHGAFARGTPFEGDAGPVHLVVEVEIYGLTPAQLKRMRGAVSAAIQRTLPAKVKNWRKEYGR